MNKSTLYDFMGLCINRYMGRLSLFALQAVLHSERRRSSIYLFKCESYSENQQNKVTKAVNVIHWIMMYCARIALKFLYRFKVIVCVLYSPFYRPYAKMADNLIFFCLHLN